MEWFGTARRGARITDRDRLLILALQQWERGLCRGDCGQHKDDSFNSAYDRADPSSEGYFQAEQWICMACKELARAQRSWNEMDGADNDGLQWSTRLVHKHPPHTNGT